MRKNKETFEDYKVRLQELAGIKPINESRVGTSTTILSTEKGADGTNYVIVKEEGSYYIKTTKSEVITESTIDYIGGLQNKNSKFKYDSYADAVKNLNMLMITINESFNFNKEDEVDVVDERLEKDMEDEAHPMDVPPAPGEGGEIPQDQPLPEPQPQSQEPAAQAPSPEPQPEPQQQAPAPEGQPAPQDGGLAADDSDLETPADDQQGGDGIDHYVGKLTAEIRSANQEQMNPDKVKSILNSIISALPLESVSPEERLVLARRVKFGGRKENADTGVEETITIPVSEIIAPLDKPTSQFKNPHDFNKEDDLKINEFFSDLDKSKLIVEGNNMKYDNSLLFEGVDGKVIMNHSDQKYTFDVSEDTFNKFNEIIKENAIQPINEGLDIVQKIINKYV